MIYCEHIIYRIDNWIIVLAKASPGYTIRIRDDTGEATYYEFNWYCGTNLKVMTTMVNIFIKACIDSELYVLNIPERFNITPITEDPLFKNLIRDVNFDILYQVTLNDLDNADDVASSAWE